MHFTEMRMTEDPHTRAPAGATPPPTASRPGRPFLSRLTERRPRVVMAAVAAALVAGVFTGYSIAASEVRRYRQEAAQAREELATLARAHETLQERNWILYLKLEESRARGERDSAETPAGVYGDGTYRVGPDIPPGTYTGDVVGDFGYWARLNSTTGMVSGIEANAVVRGPFVLTIIASDVAVELRGVTLKPGD